MPDQKDLPVISFKTPKEMSKWLQKNHSNPDGFWLRFFKKDSGEKSINYKEAVDVALCFGWIDGQADSYDEQSWLQRFTPRRTKSIWSKRNRENVARLIEEGRMQPAGLKEIERAKADGRWENAYDGSASITAPEDFLKLLSKNKKANAFFATLNKANTYAIFWRLQTAKKPETREKRMKLIMEMLSKGEKFH